MTELLLTKALECKKQLSKYVITSPNISFIEKSISSNNFRNSVTFFNNFLKKENGNLVSPWNLQKSFDLLSKTSGSFPKISLIELPVNQCKETYIMEGLHYFGKEVAEIGRVEVEKQKPNIYVALAKNSGFFLGVVVCIGGIYYLIKNKFLLDLLEELGLTEFLRWLRRFLRRMLGRNKELVLVSEELVVYIQKILDFYSYEPYLID